MPPSWGMRQSLNGLLWMLSWCIKKREQNSTYLSSSKRYHCPKETMSARITRTLKNWLIQLHLVVESGIISIMSIINLSFVIDNTKQIIFIHRFRAKISKVGKTISMPSRYHKQKKTHGKVEPLFSFSISFKAGVVKGAIFRDAGKRIAVSIFRAEDLSFVLCSNLCRIKEIMVSLV